MIRNLNQIGLKPVPDVVPVKGAYRSLNPRAFDSARAIHNCLDKPSETAGVNEYTICRDPSLQNYHAGAPYGTQTESSTTYAIQDEFPGNCPSLNYNIKSGEIGYYVDESIKCPYFYPVFNMPAKEEYYSYIDPMDSWKPCYIRIPQRADQYSNLSFIGDTTFYREDIMALQMNKFNRSRSEPFL